MPLSSTPLHKDLLAWYKKNARDLPWRRTRDPYKIWVSEIMLQQTQVQTVIPYYEKWLKRFPDAASLAKAPEGEVMKYWAGLGYYRRARMLHKAAREVMENHGGVLPCDPAALLKLSGIGRYTAGAIASIAFEIPAPIVDGNVIRILSRIFNITDDISKPASLKKFWKISEEVVPALNPGDFNQAMMELGATVCLPQNPKCGVCPVQKNCRAFAEKTWDRLPVNKGREKLQKKESAALILKKNGKVLLEKQPSSARWGGLWMFPHGTDRKSILKKFGLQNAQHRLTLYHGFTKYKVRLDVYESELDKNPAAEGDFKWTRISDLEQVAFPSPHRKISESLTP